MTNTNTASGAADLIAALEDAQRAINSMKVEAETAAQGDDQMMLEACETISNEGLQADMAIRAVLDKWGQPAHSGEPVAWRYVSSKVWGEFVYTEDPKRAQHARDNGIDVQPVFTTPKPTQAQAGAVPLTDEQSKALTQARSTAMRMAAEGRIPECGDFSAIAQNLDWLCDSCGIKGGQHAD